MPSNYTAQDQFNTIQTYDISDDVLGGASGDANTPVKQLADRTEWLKNRTGKYKERIDVGANATIDTTYLHKLILLRPSSSNIVVQLPSVASFNEGDILHFKCKAPGIRHANLKTTGSQPIIFDNGMSPTETWFYDGEILKLVATGEGWEVDYEKGHFTTVGEMLDGMIVHKNMLIRNGALPLRTDYPRLWWWAENKLVAGQTLLSYATWNSHAYRYKGCFNTGNGTTTFGIPDDRGMFTRYLDQGRGVSSSRVHNYAGGFEQDQVGEHEHLIYGQDNDAPPNGRPQEVANIEDPGTSGAKASRKTSKHNPGGETIVKNNAKLPLLRY